MPKFHATVDVVIDTDNIDAADTMLESALGSIVGGNIDSASVMTVIEACNPPQAFCEDYGDDNLWDERDE